MSVDNFASGLLGAGIGAAGAVLSTIFTIRHESQKIEGERKAEREKDLQNLVVRYLSISQDAAESLWFIIRDIYEEKGARRIRSADEYRYSILTMVYTLGRFFAVKQIMTLEGAYSSVEAVYPSKSIEPVYRYRDKMPESKAQGGLGVYLRTQFVEIGSIIDGMIEDIDKLKNERDGKNAEIEIGTKLSRHIRQQLGEAIMRREDGQWIVIRLLDFVNMNNTEGSASYLGRLFVWVEDDFVNRLRTSLSGKAVQDNTMSKREQYIVLTAFRSIMRKLEEISDTLSKVTGLPSLPHRTDSE